MSSVVSKGLAFFALVCLFSSAFGQSSGLNRILQKYHPYVEESKNGMAFLVRKGGQVETGSIGEYDFDENTVFNIGSNTKTMTAVLVLQEQEKGRLSISDSIGTYLDKIDNVDGSLSIEELLRHESGLGEVCGEHFMTYFYCADDSAYRTDFTDKIPAPQDSMRGKYEYCNTNYFLLGHILEKVTDRSYFDLLRERIFEPCGMRDSHPYVHTGIEHLATPTLHGKDVSEHLNHKFFSKYAFSAGSVASTLKDMYSFYDHLYIQGSLLSDQSFALMTDFGSGEYGMGMMTERIGGTDYIGHGGNNVGFAYRNYFDPATKNLCLIFGNDLYMPVEGLISKEIDDYLNQRPTFGQFDDNTTKVFKKHIGKYRLEKIDHELEIVKNEDRLFLNVQGMELALVSLNENCLIYPSYGIRMELMEDSKDLTFYQSGEKLLMKREK